ncbi:endonuclease/exonuclease/phosphatase family protein [Arsenicibacter rosenii]|uniref:endonuclease/exonuclease/phosphatase family protein n=1 Tax=Arsenicibacter rosenii TaxID=1750698 RepID=UPI001E31B56A|nr:endonuclease/exonuclease/phosphatase family protein [Arsenicibacter rosenii]
MSVGTYSATLTFEGGGATASVPITGTVTSNTAPALNTNPVNLSGFFTAIGTPSTAQSYTVNGVNLTGPVTVSAPAGYEISLNGSAYASTTTVSPVSGSVSQGVFVRLTGAAVGSFTGTVTHVSTGLTATVPVSGTVNPPAALTVNSAGLTLAGTQGTPSATQSYIVSATALTAALVVSAPTGIEISSNGTSFSSSLTLASSTTSATITARLTGLNTGAFSGNITNVSGSLSAVVPVSGSVSSTGEIVLTGGSYTQNFDGIGTQLPTGWSVRTGATATGLGSTQLLTVAPTLWNNTGGSFKNLASGDIGLSASTTDQGNATDRALGVRQSGSLGDPGAAFTAKLARTTGFQSFSLTFKLQSLDASSPRVTTWRVDYGFGETPTSFTALTVTGPLTVGGSAVSNNTIGVDFGTALDNVNTPVWVRIVALSSSSGSGNRPTTGIDDFSLTYSPVQPVLTVTPASLTGANGLEYFAGSGPASRTVTVSGKFLTPDAGNITVTTSDATNFAVSTDGTAFGATASLPYTGSALAATNLIVRLNNSIAIGDTYATTLTISGGGTTPVMIPVSGTVLAAGTKVLRVQPVTLNSFTTTQGTLSDEQTYTLTATNLTEDIVIVAPAGVEVSEVSGIDFASSLTLPASTTLATIYVHLTGETVGSVNGSITHAANGLSAAVTVGGTVSNSVSIGGLITMAEARTVAVNSVVTLRGQVTVSSQFGGNLFYVQDETGGIAFYNASTAYGNQVQLGDRVQATGSVTVYQGARELVITSFSVVQTGLTPPAPKVVTLDQLTANEGWLVQVDNAAIGGTGTSFSPTTYPLTADGASGTLYIKAQSGVNGAGKPASATIIGISEHYTSGVTNINELMPRLLSDVSGATAPVDLTCAIPGSTTLTADKTLDIAAWNVEFFGADAGSITCAQGTYAYDDQGPLNEALQKTNVATVINKLNADIIATEEVSDINLFAQMVSSIPGSYSYACSDKFSYFFQDECQQTVTNGKVFGPTAYGQKVCVIYNTATITPIPSETKALLLNSSSTYTYPTGNGWASGRLPYMFVANATINGVTRKIHVVVIHAKSGSASADFTRRRQDYNDLKTVLDTQYPNANIVMLGDYNDKATASIYTASPISSFNSFVADETNYATLTKPLELQNCSTFNSSASFIDHMIVSNDLNRGYLSNSMYVLQPFSIPGYGTTTSDHNPIAARFDLSQLPAPTVALAASGTVTCANPTVTLTASVTGTGPFTYTVVGAGIVSQSATSATVNQAGTYTVIVTDQVTSATASATATVTSNTVTPTASLVASNTLTCTQTSVTLTASGGQSYTIAGPGLATPATTSMVVVNQAGSYTATVANANGCPSTTTVTVAADQSVPSVSLVVSGTLTCAQTSATLTASGATSYTLLGPGLASPVIGNTAVVSVEGVYTVIGSYSNTCSATVSAGVTSNTIAPMASLAANGAVTCASVATLVASGGSSYTFTGPNGVVSSTGTTAIATQAGAYTVLVANVNGCTATAQTTVVAGTLPPLAMVASGSAVGCGASSVTLTASGATSYTAVGPDFMETNTTGVFVITKTGSYTVSGLVNTGCVAVATHTVNAGITPSATNVQVGSMNKSTGGCMSVLTATATGTRFTFTGPDGYVFSYVFRTPGTYPIVAPNLPVTGGYTLTVSGGDGCGSAVYPVTVTEMPCR